VLDTPEAKARFLAFMGYEEEQIADALRDDVDDPEALAAIVCGQHRLNEEQDARTLERERRSVQAEHDLTATNWR
jgi:hypothetical protein